MTDTVTIALPRDVAQRFYDLQRTSLEGVTSVMDRHDSDEDWAAVEEWGSILVAFEGALAPVAIESVAITEEFVAGTVVDIEAFREACAGDSNDAVEAAAHELEERLEGLIRSVQPDVVIRDDYDDYEGEE